MARGGVELCEGDHGRGFGVAGAELDLGFVGQVAGGAAFDVVDAGGRG